MSVPKVDVEVKWFVVNKFQAMLNFFLFSLAFFLVSVMVYLGPNYESHPVFDLGYDGWIIVLCMLSTALNCGKTWLFTFFPSPTSDCWLLSGLTHLHILDIQPAQTKHKRQTGYWHQGLVMKQVYVLLSLFWRQSLMISCICVLMSIRLDETEELTWSHVSHHTPRHRVWPSCPARDTYGHLPERWAAAGGEINSDT